MTGCEALHAAAVAVVAAVEAHGYHGAIPADVRATVERMAALLDVQQPPLTSREALHAARDAVT